MNQYPNTLFETAEQRAERELYEAQRKAFFESIPKRAEQTLIVGQSSESLVEELRRQLSELGVLRALDQQRIAALESELAANTLPCGHHHSLMLKSAETGDQLYCELCDLRDQRNDLEIELEAIQRVAEQYQDEAGTLAHELAQARAECEKVRNAVAIAYGHLWHVNNEPMAPIPMYSPEKAAYAARKELRDLLTSEQRGDAINATQHVWGDAARKEGK